MQREEKKLLNPKPRNMQVMNYINSKKVYSRQPSQNEEKKQVHSQYIYIATPDFNTLCEVCVFANQKTKPH